MVKHLQRLFSLTLLCCAFIGSGNAWGQVLKEHFNYAAGSTLTSNGWSAHSSAGTNSITVTSGGNSLMYRDYAGSGIGNAVTLKTSGEDVNRSFTASTSGAVYAGFLVNVSAASTGDYFFHLGPSTIGTSFLGRVFAKASGDGFQLGVSKGSSPAAVYGETVYELNKTYLVVLKYTFVEGGTTNDNVELFVNPVMRGAEPAAATVTAAAGGTDATNIGSVALRQGSSTAAPELTVDGVVVATSWSELRGATPLLTENFSYSPNTRLTESGNWTAHSSAGTNAITTTSGGSSLVYNGYAASGVGEAIQLQTSGEDVNRTFESVNEGNLYASFLINVATAAATGDYFFHLGPETLGSTFVGRVFAKSSGSGFQLGLSKGSSPAPVYGETVYDFNRTYLVVLKYTFVEGATTNDNLVLYVNPAISGGEPASATVTAAAGGTDASNLGSVALRQGSASNAASLVVDGIVIGTAWEVLEGTADVTAPTVVSFSPASGATGVETTTQELTLTFSENVVKGTGNIVLADAANAANNRTIDVASSAVVVNGATVTIPVSLAPNTSYYVQIPQTAFTDRAGNAFAGVNNTTTWTFSTVQFATPVLTTSVSVVAVPYRPLGAPAQAATYVLRGTDLREPVTVAATGAFEVSADGTTFATSVAVPAAEVAAGKTIFVRLNATAEGDYNGTVTHSTTGAESIVLNVTGGIYNPYANNFNTCAPVGSTAISGGWRQISVVGAQTWGCTTFGRENEAGAATNAVQINGFSGGAQNNEDWLISPALDLTTFSNIPVLSLWTRSAFAGPGLKLMVSTNYDGTSAPSTAQWTELNANFPESGSDVWTKSEVLLDAYKQTNVHVAIVYTSVAQTNGASRWTVDDFLITNETQKLITSALDFDFGAVAAGLSTAGRAFTLRALGFNEEVVVSVPANFQVSKDNTTFAQSISYTAAEAANEQTVYVRFAPATTALAFTGAITFASGSSFNQVAGNLRGSSIPKSTTLDIVTWNVEWFGADRDANGSILGPVDDQLQYQNVKQAMQVMDADIYALQEIANDEMMAQLVAELPGYSFAKSDVFSYSIRPSTNTMTAQKLYFVYKNETVRLRSQKVLLKDLYTKLIANEVVLPNYPGTGTDAQKDDSFWASGRLPYLAEFDVTIGGVTQRIHVLNIHARANSGTNTTVYHQRDYDLRVLKDSLDAHYANVNLVMLGDYNDDVDVSVVGNNPSTYAPFVTDPKYKVLTYELSLNTTEGTYQRSSFLDHISVSSSFEDEYIPNSVRIEEGLYSLIARYHTTTSDHAPVSARFTLSGNPTRLTGAANNLFSVYPNPIKGKINIVLPEKVGQSQINLTLWSAEGRKLFEVAGNQEQVQQMLNSHVNSLPNGLFIMKVVSGKDVYQVRVVKN